MVRFNSPQKDSASPYYCSACKIWFCSEEALSNHIEKRHPINYRRDTLTCKECGKKFVSNFALYRHFKKAHPA